MYIKKQLEELKNQLPEHVQLVAISKTHPNEQIMKAYDTGHRAFGENRVQELEVKYEALPKDIEWHLVGHLQRNKVKYIAPFVHLIHAVDSLRLLREIEKQGKRFDRKISCLLQLKIATEDSKFGMEVEDIKALLESEDFKNMEYVKVEGLMGMASFTEDEEQVRQEFTKIKNLYNELKDEYDFNTLSIGMSGDYPIAIEEGSTMIRVGSAIFGQRDYN